MSNFITILQDQSFIIIQKTGQQSCLALIAIFIAILISVPTGIIIAKKARLRKYILGFNGVIQTLPSLAVLGLLLPIFGIGVKTALIALTLYALLPILRNTVAGLLAVSPDILEAANSLGMKKSQIIRRIELPLALPFIVAGIRTAMAMVIGIATLAALIGAGGLGDFIYEGLALNNINLILMGAIPAALLALSFDFLIGLTEQMLTRRHISKSHVAKRNVVSFAIVCVTVFSLLFFLILSVDSKKNNVIRVGSKNFSEQLILGELIAQLLEAKTKLDVKRTFNLGGTFICHRAIINDEIDLYPEYTGTSYSVILNKEGLQDPAEVFKYVSRAYLERFNLIWLNEFGFNNSNALALDVDLAKGLNVHTIQDLKKYAPNLTIGVPADFMKRPDGFAGLKKIYDLQFAHVRLMEVGLMYKAVFSKEVNVIMAFSTDARLRAYKLVTLVDNKHLFPPYYAAPVVRKDFLRRHPEIAPILKSLAGKINEAMMIELNYQVDILHRTPYEVAKEYLLQQHLLNSKD